jgi:GTPase SAR1 family protein
MNLDDYIYIPSKKVYERDELLGIKAASHKRIFADYNPSTITESFETKPVLTNSINNTNYLVVVPNKYDNNGNNDEIELLKSNFKKKVLQNDYITQFYMGSLSIIGLYIFFQYLYVKK